VTEIDCAPVEADAARPACDRLSALGALPGEAESEPSSPSLSDVEQQRPFRVGSGSAGRTVVVGALGADLRAVDRRRPDDERCGGAAG